MLASLGAVAPVATDLYLPGLPAMGEGLDAGPSGVQLTLTAFLVGLAFGQLVMGPLSDRFGRRRPLVLSATVCVVAGVVCALAPTLPVLLAGRLVQGFSGAGGMVIGRALIADLVTGRAAAKAFTLMITVGGVAPVLAPLVGSLLADPVGWRGMLWTVAGLCAVMLVGVAAGRAARRIPPRPGTAHREASPLGGIRQVLGIPAYRRQIAVSALSFAVLMAYISSSPFVYQNVVGLSEVEYGVAFGVNAARPDRGRLGRQPAGRPVVAEPGAAGGRQRAAGGRLHVRRARGGRRAGVDAPGPDLLRGRVERRDHGQLRRPGDVDGPAGRRRGQRGPRLLHFALGALVSPLVGLGGEDSALVPGAGHGDRVRAQLHAEPARPGRGTVSPARPRA